MREKLKLYVNYLLYSFPVQLLLLHFKQHVFILLFWVMLFLMTFQAFGVSYGIPLLMLEPEYLGAVNFWSFLLVGITLGGFFMAWNISVYMLSSYRYGFLASLQNPFLQFSLNNSLIPIVFTITYITQIIKFQHTESLLPTVNIFLNVLALLTGIVFIIFLISIFFIIFDYDISILIKKFTKQSDVLFKDGINKMNDAKQNETEFEKCTVKTYFQLPLKVKIVCAGDFYEKKLVDEILLQHHFDVMIFQIIVIVFIIILGKLMNIPLFIMPAISAIFMVCSVGIVAFSLLTYWFRAWRTLAIIVLLIILNILTKYGYVIYKHHLYGLDYQKTKLLYNNKTVQNAVNNNMEDTDITNTLNILNKWHSNMLQKYGEKKPKLIIINTAGGGLKAAYWSFFLLQELEKQTNNKLLSHTALMTGASGGMLGAAYFRELYLQSKSDSQINYLNTVYLNDMGKDILNSVATSIATNDIFYPWQNYTYKGFNYKKDRGYMFDLKFNENTQNRLSKLLTAYKTPEQEALIPMMIVSSTIINDQRFLLFSPQGISYLLKPYIQATKANTNDLSTDAVEFMHYFKDRGAENINVVDVLLTNATYPYIMPVVYLPTTPEVKVMDAGIRDNTGLAISTRYYNVFKNWMDENTSGVILISLRVDGKYNEFNTHQKDSFFGELLSPIGGIFNNFFLLQNYNDDVSLAFLVNSGNTDISILNFNYLQSNLHKKASMSWHLTNNEKQDIKNAFLLKQNQLMVNKLKLLLNQ